MIDVSMSTGCLKL